MVTREKAKELVETYEQAWTRQDPDLILMIFTEDAEYGEYLLRGSYKGHEAIRQYWIEKVVNEQSEIDFDLLNLYVDGDTVVAEWDVSFYSNKEEQRIHIVEVAILEIRDGKIQRLREYWHSERL